MLYSKTYHSAWLAESLIKRHLLHDTTFELADLDVVSLHLIRHVERKIMAYIHALPPKYLTVLMR